MASNLTVNLGAGKKQLVKTTPTMILRQVVNIVCEKQNYAEPENYGLKSGKNFLDLSLSIRYANIAPGAKLELARIPKDRSAPTHVDLALQLEDGGRMIQSFALTTTLWDVLLGFEKASNGSFNLTRRTAVPQPTATKNIFSLQRIKKSIKPAVEVYLLPIVILLEREYVSIATLKTTTLQLAGLHKGNAVFRVMMRYTDAGIDEFMEEIERDYSGSTVASNGVSGTSSPSTTSNESSKTPPSSSSPVRKAEPSIQTSPTKVFKKDKTAGEQDFCTTNKDANHRPDSNLGTNVDGIQTPLPDMTARAGGVDNSSREGNLVAPTPGSNELNIQRQTPVQDMNTAMIEANLEIRQLREQETQAALTDRVKRLSKTSDSSDRERFVRSLPPVMFTDEPVSEMDVDHTQPSPESAAPLSHEEVVRQIAHRVSLQLKQAQKRGNSTMDYHMLIAQEIEKEQRAGVLPSTPTGSRHNSMYRSKSEDESSGQSVEAATVPQPQPSATVEEPVARDVKVFKPPADTDVPLSNQIDLPDDFYTLTSQDVMKLMSGQKAKREEAENRGFKTAAARAEEEKAKERRYPNTIIRIRFPDRVQLQATFCSQDTIGDVRKWVAGACVGHGEKFDLYTTPPKKILADDKQTLYQAGLAPQSIVYFSWKDSKLNSDSPFLNGEYMMKMQDLPIPGLELGETKAETTSPFPGEGQGLNRTGSVPAMTKEQSRMSDRMSSSKSGGSSSSSGGLPKWMRLSKK
ncbi:Tether containing UBX domain for GLUT4 [Mortierella polycephala]|uniref:Tether containing UBX domain for GLUT4 n=1 Tax=Mortierella polycephala TaxID=41804 RepID=A0A9P6Q5X9_9FUNG|nr:Tether containing UBX domain for GLUT4 [Mortierella polycephala]